MGNQIKFSPKKMDDSPDDDDYQTLEIKNFQLKNTNRKLISKLDQQKHLIKTLKKELESIKNNQQLKDFYELKKDHQRLKTRNDKAQERMVQYQKEITELKKEIKELTNNSSKDSKNSSPWNKLKNLRN
jgi:predicted  nucleic acid-binding Zn-ribbon protein